MKTTVTLENKDVREIIAKFLGVKIEDVIPNRYSFAIANMCTVADGTATFTWASAT